MKQPEPTQPGSGQSPTDLTLLAAPLDFISEDHLHERQICAVIDGLVSATSFDRWATLTVLRFLNEELNVHMRDEAEDLFPLLAQRCTAEDEIERTITRIRSDLDEVSCLLPEVRAILVRCLDEAAGPTDRESETLLRFSGHARRHLAAENAILLPIAHARLTKRDLQTLSQHMRERRGLPSNSEKIDGA